jgi:hypothetical protein
MPTPTQARWRPEPLAIVALVGAWFASVELYLKSGDLVGSSVRMSLYGLLMVAPIAVVLSMAIIRGEGSALRRFAVPLAAAGLIVSLLHGLFVWGAFTSVPLCGSTTSCTSPASWLDWFAVAVYFATIAAASTVRRPATS